MEERITLLLEEAGVAVQETLERFMGDQEMLLSFLRAFPSDENMPALRQALDAQDAQTAFRAAHTLKGVTGNLGFTALYQWASQVTEALRGGDLVRAQALMPGLEDRYARTLQALKALG